MDEAVRAQYEAREAWLKDEATRRSEALAEGEIATKLRVAQAQLNILDDATIANTLSLSIAIVKRLRAGKDVAKIQEELLAERPFIRA